MMLFRIRSDTDLSINLDLSIFKNLCPGHLNPIGGPEEVQEG